MVGVRRRPGGEAVQARSAVSEAPSFNAPLCHINIHPKYMHVKQAQESEKKEDGVRTLAQTWAEFLRVQVSPNGISSFRPHHPKLLSLQEMMCGIRPNLSPCNTSGGVGGG